MAKTNGKMIANNKKAYHDYFILDTYEAGIVLHGTEVKSLRMGKCSIKESFIRIENGEVFIYGMHISPYEKGNIFNKDPLRVKKLMLHKAEINKLIGKTKEKEIEKVIYQIGSTYYANYRNECVEKMPELAAQIKSLQDEIAANKEIIEKLSTEEICPQCGKKVNPGSKFCIYCGAALEAPAEQPEEKAEVKVCKACGKPLEEGVVFCTNCGTKIEDDKATEEN